MLLWVWLRPIAAATIRLLAWEPPYAMGAALKKAKTNTQKNNKQKKSEALVPIKLYVTRFKSVAFITGDEEMDTFIVSMKMKLNPCPFGLKAVASTITINLDFPSE